MHDVTYVGQSDRTTAPPEVPTAMPVREAPIRVPIREDVRRRVLAMLERVKAREVAIDLATREGLAQGEAKRIAERKIAKPSRPSVPARRVSPRPVASRLIPLRGPLKRK